MMIVLGVSPLFGDRFGTSRFASSWRTGLLSGLLSPLSPPYGQIGSFSDPFYGFGWISLRHWYHLGPVHLESCLFRCVRYCQIEQKSFLNCCDMAKQLRVSSHQCTKPTRLFLQYCRCKIVNHYPTMDLLLLGADVTKHGNTFYTHSQLILRCMHSQLI